MPFYIILTVIIIFVKQERKWIDGIVVFHTKNIYREMVVLNNPGHVNRHWQEEK